MNPELWLPIHGYEDSYEVSNLARVRSKQRVVQLKNGNTRTVNEKLLTVQTNRDGYLYVRLHKEGNSLLCYIHRLVATAFLHNPEGLPQVNHLKSKSNNQPEDLEWVSCSRNTKHAYDTGLNTHQGEGHFLATGIVDNELGQSFSTIKDWCTARGIPYSTGRNILSGTNKSNKINKTLIIKISPNGHDKSKKLSANKARNYGLESRNDRRLNK